MKEAEFKEPVHIGGMIGRPVTSWAGEMRMEGAWLILTVPLSDVETCVPESNIRWRTRPVPKPMTEIPWGTSIESMPPNREASPTGITPAPGKGKKR